MPELSFIELPVFIELPDFIELSDFIELPVEPLEPFIESLDFIEPVEPVELFIAASDFIAELEVLVDDELPQPAATSEIAATISRSERYLDGFFGTIEPPGV